MNIELEKNKEKLLDKFNKIMNSKKKKNKNQIMKELFNDNLNYIENEEDYNSKIYISNHTSKAKSMPNIFGKEEKKENKTVVFNNKNLDKEEKKDDFEFLTNLQSINVNNNIDHNLNNLNDDNLNDKGLAIEDNIDENIIDKKK